MVGILIFVNHNVTELCLIVIVYVGVFAQKLYRFNYHIVKIHSVCVLQTLLVYSVKLGDCLFTHIASRVLFIFGRVYKLVLSGRYAGKHAFMRENFIVYIFSAHNFLHQPALIVCIVNCKMRGKAQSVGIAAQYFAAYRVECACPYILAAVGNFSGNSFLKLACRLVCKGYCKNVPRIYGRNGKNAVRNIIGGSVYVILAPFNLLLGKLTRIIAVVPVAEFNQICNTVYKHGGLTASRTRKHQNGTVYGSYRLKLHIVHFTEIFFYYLTS